MDLKQQRTHHWQLIVLAAVAALAAGTRNGNACENDPQSADHAVFERCARQAGLVLPEPGTRPRTPPTPDQRVKIDACLKAAGIAPPNGPRGAPPAEEVDSDTAS